MPTWAGRRLAVVAPPRAGAGPDSGDQNPWVQIFSMDRRVSAPVARPMAESHQCMVQPSRMITSLPKKPLSGGSPTRLMAATKKATPSQRWRFRSPPIPSRSSEPAWRSITPQHRNRELFTTMCWIM